jgi:hypothetical protein
VSIAVLSAGAVLGLLAVEASLTAADERKLAAGISGLAVAAAVVLLLCLTLLAADVLRALRGLVAGGRPAGRSIESCASASATSASAEDGPVHPDRIEGGA